MNAAQCNGCGDVIRSVHRHDFVTCSCGDVSVDGGDQYIRRAFQTGASWAELRTDEEFEAARNQSHIKSVEDDSE